MLRVREAEDKAKAPKLDKDASKRFVRNALWQQAHKRGATDSSPATEGGGVYCILSNACSY